MSRTIATVEAEIADVRAAISTLIKGGQSYSINSGGSQRTVTQLDLPNLRSWLIHLQQELAELNQSADTRGIIMGPNW